MTRKRFDTSRPIEPPNADNLKLINGIGPVVESRLHGVGVYTFARLAALTPADIAAAVADVAGLATERIIKQDWIGQARRLAEEQKQSGIPAALLKEVEPAELTSEEAEPAASFSAEIESVTPTSEGVVIPAPTPPTRELVGIPRLSELETFLPGIPVPYSILPSEQRFEVRFILDLTDVAAPPGSGLNYTASIFGKSLDGRVRYPLGVVNGKALPADKVTINVEGKLLPQGLYRVEALVSLSMASEKTQARPQLFSYTKGNPLQVY